MSDWFDCNKCGIIYRPQVKFFLVECSHIFCETCIVGIKETKCVICQKSDCYIEICENMDPNIHSYFIPYDQLMKKLMETWQFQSQHRIRKFQTLAKKYTFAKRECIKLYNRNKALVHQNKVQQNWIEQAKVAMMTGMVPQSLFRSDQMTTSTPSMTPARTSDRSGMDDMSLISSIPPCTPTSNYGSTLTVPAWKRPMMNAGNQLYSQHQQQQPQPQHHQRQYPPNVTSGGSAERYPPRGLYRPSPAQMLPGSGERRPMGGTRPPPTSGAAVSMHHLQQHGSAAKRA